MYTRLVVAIVMLASLFFGLLFPPLGWLVALSLLPACFIVFVRRRKSG
jgi:hypothetical protein